MSPYLPLVAAARLTVISQMELFEVRVGDAKGVARKAFGAVTHPRSHFVWRAPSSCERMRLWLALLCPPARGDADIGALS